MERLRTGDMRAILGFVGDAYALAPRGGFRLHTMERLRALVPSDMAAWVETYTDRPQAEAIASPHDLLPDGPRRFARIRDEHPILAHFERCRDGSAVKLSDFFAPAQYRRLRFYQEFFRPAGVEHQLSMALPRRGPRLIRITLNRRRRDFSERDRLVLNLVRLHVAQAHQNAEAFERIDAERGDLERAAEALHVGVIVVRGRGRAMYMNPRAREQLAVYFAPHPVRHDSLPDALAGWFAAHPPPRQPLVVEQDGSRLEIRSLAEPDGCLLVLRERLTRIAPRPLESLGLTRRQAEVLAWLAQGKANSEIASILEISPNTVARHLEAIFATLGVETRTAAAAEVFAHLSMR
jgi:DNA-binding CsgD family transcriptional regulator/PAS domain-containing protein